MSFPTSTPSVRCFKYFQTILVHSPKIVSVYVGLEDGSFRQTRRIDPEVKIQDKLPPQGSRYAYRWIVPKAGERTLDHFLYLDADLKELGSSDQPTAYDPRARLWYRSAAEARTEDDLRSRRLRDPRA